MPKADVGNEQTSMSGGLKGEFKVTFQEISDKVMRAKEGSDFPDSLRLVYAVQGGDKTVSLSVPIEDPSDDLWGFCADHPAAPRVEGNLRQFIREHIFREPISVYVRDSFIRGRLAPEGEHIFVQLLGTWTYEGGEGARRIGMTAVTKDGLTATWSCKDPGLRCEVGKTPEQDYIGDEKALNPNQYVFQYLQAFGLNWERMKSEDLAQARAYWPAHYDATGLPIEPLFPSEKNPWPGFLSIIKRHGGNPVKIEIVNDPKYGLGPKRVGQFPIVKMTPVVMVGSENAAQAEFDKDVQVFTATWEMLAQAVLGRPAPLLVGGKLTDDGRTIFKAFLMPVIHAHVGMVKVQWEDGRPKAVLPPTMETWRHNGLAVAVFIAQRLLKMGEEWLVDPTNPVVALTGDRAAFLEWAETNVPEAAADMTVDEKGEEL